MAHANSTREITVPIRPVLLSQQSSWSFPSRKETISWIQRKLYYHLRILLTLRASYPNKEILNNEFRSWGFPGLRQGDRWCLCAFRWNQAYKAYLAGEISINGVPKLLGTATHEKTAEMVTGGMDTIEQFIYRD